MKLKTDEHFIMEEIYDRLDTDIADSINKCKDTLNINNAEYNYDFAMEIIELTEIKIKVYKALCEIDIPKMDIRILKDISDKHSVLDIISYIVLRNKYKVNINNKDELCQFIKDSINILSITKDYIKQGDKNNGFSSSTM